MSDDLIEEKFKVHDDKITNHEDRIKNLEKIYVIMAEMKIAINNIKTDNVEIKDDIKKIKTNQYEESNKKGMKWDKLIDYLFYAILAYCLYKLGIKK